MAVDDKYTKALLHMNGADASTTFRDESGRTWTAYANAQIDTAQSKFGGASGIFDGTGDYIDTPDSADFDVGSGDFTVDFWARRNATGGTSFYICGQVDATNTATSSSIRVAFISDTVVFVVRTGSSTIVVTSTGTITDSNWHHIACVRDGNTLRLFIDGTADGTGDITGLTVNNSANAFAIGRAGEYDGEYFNGWTDEFRFSKGIARWVVDFTPPTREYKAKGVQMML